MTDEDKDLKIGSPKDYAGGVPAVTSSLAHMKTYTGLVRGLFGLGKMNQKKGFDCPGCAWPDPDHHRSPLGEYCENGVKAFAEEATTRRLKPQFFKDHSLDELATKTDFWLGKRGRITQPFYKSKSSRTYEPISWEEAYSKIGNQIKKSEPDKCVFYTSGRASNEAAFAYQLMVRKLGTNNLPDCSNMCHESSGAALSRAIGIGKGTVTIDDIETAKVIIIFGQNPGTNHPRMLSSLRQASLKGAHIVAVNPLKEAGLLNFRHPQEPQDLIKEPIAIASEYLQIPINGDMALIRGLSKALLEQYPKGLDQEFIEGSCQGFQEYKGAVDNTSWQDIHKICQVDEETIKKLAQRIISTKSLVSCWAMGLTQHKNAVATIREIANLHLLGGLVGKAGSGLCPVRGHSNVQGDRTMGIWEKPPEAFLKSLEDTFGFEAPRHHGFDVVEAVEAMLEGKVDVFFALGGNIVSAGPDTKKMAEAMSKVKLTVQVSTKLNRSHLDCGEEAIILPCLGRTEADRTGGKPQFVTVENSMGIVHSSQGPLAPASKHLKSEVDIVCSVAAEALSEASPWDGYRQDYNLIRDDIARVIPGFEDFNQRIQKPEGFYLPNPPRDERRFATPSGKAHFSHDPLTAVSPSQGRLGLMTIRSHDQFNTTIYGLHDRYRGITSGRRVIFINQADRQRLNLGEGAMVDIDSHFEGQTRSVTSFKLVDYDIPEGCTAAYFPETNPLVPLASRADISQTPTSKFVEISLRPTSTSTSTST